MLGFVDQQVSDRNSNFFHGTKIGACLGLLYVPMNFRRFFRSCWVFKNQNRKVKELEWDRVGGDRRVKNPEWEMRRTGQGGARRFKDSEWEMQRARGGLNGVEPNIVEITHMCIMHGAHIKTYITYNKGCRDEK